MREAKTYKTEGIILKRINYGEADRILTIFTKHYGKIRVMAKGVRKLSSRKAGSLELFNQSILFLVRGKNLDLITEAEVVNLFKNWRKDLNKIAFAYYFCELVDKLTPDNQPHPLVFELLRQAFLKLGVLPGSRLVREFEEKLLNELGFGVPEVLQKTQGSLKSYIESIIEKHLNSPKILKHF
ncbi:DNA repair protein RecO [Patescibacteria group bacterium]|nr:DNA repair protein RecO [Patescibacteria group bacterium]